MVPHFVQAESLFKYYQRKKEVLWALEEVSFKAFEGEAVGIIGPNGAGKSTLLKVLSRVTEPSMGRVLFRGKVASLLGVGAGFHPELTGFENIYLNGAILGMRKKEIDRKLDAIIAFSDAEEHLSTPVKHYSSGMHIRLAFSIAAHLDADILLVDEILATGDERFQEKCLQKLEALTKDGKILLLVSHDMGAIRRICPTSFLMDDGRIRLGGKTENVIDCYLRQLPV